jgi:hypothetical protein
MIKEDGYGTGTTASSNSDCNQPHNQQQLQATTKQHNSLATAMSGFQEMESDFPQPQPQPRLQPQQQQQQFQVSNDISQEQDAPMTSESTGKLINGILILLFFSYLIEVALMGFPL